MTISPDSPDLPALVDSEIVHEARNVQLIRQLAKLRTGSLISWFDVVEAQGRVLARFPVNDRGELEAYDFLTILQKEG